MSHTSLSGIGVALALGCATAACNSSEQAEVQTEVQLRAEPSSTVANRPPVIQRVELYPAIPVRGDQIRVDVVAQDPDGDSIEIGYHWFVDGKRFPGSGPKIDTSKFGVGSEIELLVIVSDGQAVNAEERVRVVIVDQPPVVIGLTVQPNENVYPGDPVVADVTTRDLDGDTVEVHYQWFVNGERASERGSEFSTAGLRRDDMIQVHVEAVALGARSSAIKSNSVRVEGARPEIVSIPPAQFHGGAFRYDVKAVDPDGDRIFRFRLDGPPEGMTVDFVRGHIEWHPTVEQAGEHQVAVIVSDSAGLEAQQRFHVTVNVDGPTPAKAAAR